MVLWLALAASAARPARPLPKHLPRRCDAAPTPARGETPIGAKRRMTSTIGIDYATKVIDSGGSPVKLTVWDTA